MNLDLRMRWVLFIAPLIAFGCGVCSEEKVADVESPDQKYVATLFIRNCGATSSYLYHVNLREARSGFSTSSGGRIEEGQVFITSQAKVRPIWKDDKTLLIECHECPADYIPKGWERYWKNISISYHPSQKLN